jgi:hypothetical protein
MNPEDLGKAIFIVVLFWAIIAFILGAIIF